MNFLKLTVIMKFFYIFQLLHDSGGFLDHLGNWELVMWCLTLGVYLLRFMTLGTQINKKYRNFSVLITEQVRVHLPQYSKIYHLGKLCKLSPGGDYEMNPVCECFCVTLFYLRLLVDA